MFTVWSEGAWQSHRIIGPRSLMAQNGVRHFLIFMTRGTDMMKSRLLVRSLCVGAALLVPVGTLMLSGIGVADATTISTVTTSTARLGTVGTITIVGIECTVAIASGTKQCTVTKSVPLKRGGVKVATALTSFKLLLTIVTSGGTKSFSEISVKMPLIIIKSTTSGINGCKISSIPKISYSKTSGNGLVWKVITKSLSGVTVTDTSSVGPCGTPVAIANEITSDKLSSAITFNQI